MQEPYQLLNAFAGTWRTAGQILATSGSPAIPVHGTDTYEWLPGGFFMLHTVDVYLGDERIQSTEIIGYDPIIRQYIMQSYDNQGNSGLMKATCTNRQWTFIGDRLRFEGGFNEAGNSISGTWEQLEDAGQWEPYMEIHLIRNTAGTALD